LEYPERLDVTAKPVLSGTEPRVAVNLAVGWSSLAVGALTGLILGIWSFGGPVPVPEWIGDYDTLSRRLLRLGHIAFFGLGILNIMLARHLGRTRSVGYPKPLALTAMNFGNVFLPVTLIGASIFEPAKYLMSLPALAVSIALIIGAYVAILDAAGTER
jgi:hypothetical protein